MLLRPSLWIPRDQGPFCCPFPAIATTVAWLILLCTSPWQIRWRGPLESTRAAVFRACSVGSKLRFVLAAVPLNLQPAGGRLHSTTRLPLVEPQSRDKRSLVFFVYSGWTYVLLATPSGGWLVLYRNGSLKADFRPGFEAALGLALWLLKLKFWGF